MRATALLCLMFTASLPVGFGSCISTIAIESVDRDQSSRIIADSLVDYAIARTEQHASVSNKAPRRQASSGVLPSNSKPEKADVTRRRLDEAATTFCSSATYSHPNDRAPPPLTE